MAARGEKMIREKPQTDTEKQLEGWLEAAHREMRDDHDRYEKLRADYKKALDTVQILDETILRVMELEKENDELRRRLIDCRKSTA